MSPGFVPPLATTEVESAFTGRYTSCTSIHNGGQAAVFRAQTNIGLAVALKVYYPTSAVDDIWARSSREVTAMTAITCPSVVRLQAHGSVVIRGLPCPFICTEFIEGTTLGGMVIAAGPMGVSVVARIGCDLLAAIEALWAKKIVHRDITPRNVMLRSDGSTVLIDLGLARHLELDSLTVTGTSWGTVGYLSPEQCDGWKNLTCKSDVFTLGVLLEECLIGGHPTGRQQPPLRAGGPDTRVLLPTLDPALRGLLQAMTAREPVRRPMPSPARQQLAPFI